MSIERELRANWDSAYYPEPEPEPVMAPGQQPGDILVAEVGSRGLPESAYSGEPPRAEMKPYDPSLMERAAHNVQMWLEGLGVDRYKARQNAQSLIGGASSNLPFGIGFLDALGSLPKIGVPVGMAMSPFYVDQAQRLGKESLTAAEQGRYGAAAMEAGLGALSLIPGVQAGMYVAKEGAKGIAKGAEYLGPKAAELAQQGIEKVMEPMMPGMVAKSKTMPKAIDLQPGMDVVPGNKIGVEPDLRVKVPDAELEMPEKPLLVLATDEKNVVRQIDNIDTIFQKFPEPVLNQDSWARTMAYAFKSNEVPIPPYAAIKAMESPESLAAPLRKLSQGQIDDASAGFKNAAEFKSLYTSGQADVVTTGKLFLWSFLSRGVSPYVQESLFMDAISGIQPFLQKAASGKFDSNDLSEYLTWASSVAGKGSGQPGSGALHNLNAFGKNFLTKMAVADKTGMTGLQKIHNMMANSEMTGPQIRREFAKIGTGVGIDNKVVSFTLLVSGRDDVLVIDRVQLRNLWDDGRFADKNLWDGRSEKRMVKQADGTEVEKRAQIAGTALSEITYGAKGLLVYEMLERAIAQQLKSAYALVGREADASLGRYHWETWVAGSQQEASHGTIHAIMREASGQKQPFKGVTAKQGEYGMFDYGAKYGVDETGPYFMYDNSKGESFRFTVPEFRGMLESIKDPKTGVVPRGFKVSESGNAPWFERPGIDRRKLDELISTSGTPVGSAPVGKQSIPADGQGAAADGAGLAGTKPKARKPRTAVSGGASSGSAE